jgi:hypothetical protein
VATRIEQPDRRSAGLPSFVCQRPIEPKAAL